MSFIEKLQNRIKEVKDGAEKMAVESGLIVDSKVAQDRLDICHECPSLFKPTGTCKECGCFVVSKTRIGGAYCPLKKW
jgi:hypothetical protein